MADLRNGGPPEWLAVTIHAAGLVHFGATDHTAGRVHIRTYFAHTHGPPYGQWHEMPVHTSDAHCSLFPLIIRLSVFAVCDHQVMADYMSNFRLGV